jgi:hypothetical protein
MHEHAEPETTRAATPARATERATATAPSAAPRAAAAPAHDRADKDGITGGVLGGAIGGLVGAGIGFLAGGPLGAVVGGVVGAAGGAAVGALAGRSGAGAAARNVVMNITKLAGVTDTVAADVTQANVIFRQANLRVSTGNTETLSAVESSAILGPDNRLDDFTGNTLTAEEGQLVTHNRTSGRITAYYVPLFSHGSVRGEAITPSDFGVADPSVVVAANHHVPDTLAHELGHVLTDAGHVSDASNLMAAGAIRNFTDNLTQSQISTMQSSPYVS